MKILFPPIQKNESAQTCLLGFALQLSHHLKKRHKIKATIPKFIYDHVTKLEFEEIMYDTLSQINIDLAQSLKIEVIDTNSFVINII